MWAGSSAVSTPCPPTARALYASLFTLPPVALDPDTGAVLWTATGDRGTTTPAVADGMVVVGSGIDNDYYGVDARTGQTRWSFPTSFGAFSQPTVFEHDVLVGSTEGITAEPGHPDRGGGVVPEHWGPHRGISRGVEGDGPTWPRISDGGWRRWTPEPERCCGRSSW